MSNDRAWPSNQSIETSVALLEQGFSAFMRADTVWKADVGATLKTLTAQVGTQNGNVARLTDRANLHDNHHGLNDQNMADRLGQLWQDRGDALVRKGVYMSAWKVGAWAFGVATSAGVLGALAGRYF